MKPDKRSSMSIRRSVSLTRRASVALLSVALSACSLDPYLRSSAALSTQSVEAMAEALEEARRENEALRQAQAEVPADVSAALIPPLGLAVEEVAPEEERFDISVANLPVREFFLGLVRDTRYNIVVSPEVEGEVTLELNDVTVPEVIEVMRDLFGYEFRTNGTLFQVLPGGIRTQVFQINYLNLVRRGTSDTQVNSGQITNNAGTSGGLGQSSSPTLGEVGDNTNQTDTDRTTLVSTSISTRNEANFWQELQNNLQVLVGGGEGRAIIANPLSGVVIARGSAPELRLVEDYLRRTELIAKRQVILEAKILSVQLSESFESGIDWSVLSTASDGDFFSFDLGSQPLISPQIQGGVTSFAAGVGDFTGLIQLLGTQGNVQVLSSPRIATVNNQKAVIKVGTDEFFVTDIDFEEGDDDEDGDSTDIELTPFFSGIALDVTPQISDDGDIIMHVHPSVSEVEESTSSITLSGEELLLPLALSSIRESDSIVRATNGQVVVIGGLIQTSSEDTNAKTPFLGDAPFIGDAFKQKRFLSNKSELVILIRPTIAGQTAFDEDLAASQRRIRKLQTDLNKSTFTTF